MASSSFDPFEYSYVIGIDFGTTFSGCCYAFSKDGNDDIIDITKWPKQQNVYPKTPTVSLYGQNSTKLLAWGQDAKRTAMKKNNHDILLSRFKLQLDENLQLEPLPNGISVLDAISDYLEAFHTHICRELQRGFANNYDQSKFRYCLTVPAMWSDKAKSIMREAATRAGLINRWDHPDRLMLISEPEAAALYCEKKCEQFNLGHGQRFLICDAGGGTVDLIVFEIDDSGEQRALKEVTKGSGDSCGSTFLDLNMRAYLEDRFYHLGKVNDSAMETMMEAFIDTIKPEFDGDEDQYLQLPVNLGIDGSDDPEVGIEDGALHIPCHELRQRVFEPVVNQVLDLIEEQIQLSNVKLDAIFLVGGFGQSTYLYRRILAEFRSRVGSIGVPPRGELAVVRGAVYFGLNPYMVKERVSRRTYGVEARMHFNPQLDPPENCIRGDNNKNYCKQRFSVYAKKGQSIEIDHCISKKFTIAYPNDTDTDLFAYDGDEPIPRLTTHPRVFKVARFPIKMPTFPDLRKGDPVHLSIKMFFGQTEIKIEVHIRDRKFTFTSAFEAVDSQMDAMLLQANGGVQLKPDENDGATYSGNLNEYDDVSSSQPPPSYEQVTSKTLSAPPNELTATTSTKQEDSVAKEPKQPSVTVNKQKKIFGFRFGKK